MTSQQLIRAGFQVGACDLQEACAMHHQAALKGPFIEVSGVFSVAVAAVNPVKWVPGD